MISFFLAIVPVVIAASALFGARFIPTHDGEYHVIRFWQFFTMLSSGYWFPRWAPDLNGGLGIPLFTFNYPFPNYIGSFFHATGLSFISSFKWTMALGYLLAALWCFLFVRKEFGNRPAVIATTIFAFVPYWFVDIYVRGSVGEVWAMSFFLLCLVGLSYRKTLVFSLSLAGLILSHNILAMMFVPMLFVIALVVYPAFFNWIWGVGMAAYFWLPALVEHSYVTGLNTVNYQDHFPALIQLLFPSWGSGYSVPGLGDQMSFQIGLIPLAILFCAVGLLVTKFHVTSTQQKLAVILLFATGISVVVMIDFSRPIWMLLPIIQYVQFPWRFLSVVTVAMPFLSGFVAKAYPRLATILALCAVLVAYGYTKPVTYEPRNDEQYITDPRLLSGTNSLGDTFQTKWFSGAYSHEFTFAGQPIEATKLTPVSFRLSLAATESGEFVAPLAYYPGWKASADGSEIATGPNSNGLVSFVLPQDVREIRIWFGSTLWRQIAAAISSLSLFAVVLSFILRRPRT